MLRFSTLLCFIFIILISCNNSVLERETHKIPTGSSTKESSVGQDTISQLTVTLYISNNEPDFVVDLDEQAPDDLQFNTTQGSGGTFFLLTPINDSKALLSRDKQLGFSGCFNQREIMLEAHINGFSKCDFICLITKTGNVVEIRIEQLNTIEGWIQISYSTWKN